MGIWTVSMFPDLCHFPRYIILSYNYISKHLFILLFLKFLSSNIFNSPNACKIEITVIRVIIIILHAILRACSVKLSKNWSSTRWIKCLNSVMEIVWSCSDHTPWDGQRYCYYIIYTYRYTYIHTSHDRVRVSWNYRKSVSYTYLPTIIIYSGIRYLSDMNLISVGCS